MRRSDLTINTFFSISILFNSLFCTVVASGIISVAVELDGLADGGHPLLADVVVLGAEDEGVAARVGEDEHQAGVLALVELKVLLKSKQLKI